MASMMKINLIGRITPDGKLEVELPPDLPPGEAKITLEVARQAQPKPETVIDAATPADEAPFTDQEIAEMLRRKPQPRTPGEWKTFFADFDPGEWADIADPIAWLEEQRLKRKTKNWGTQGDDR